MKPIFMGVLLLSGIAVAQDKPPKTYPEHGTVVAMRVGEQSRTLPVYTDPYGKTHGGMSVNRRRHIYRIETDTRFYELEGGRKPTLELNQSIEFRIEKESAYVQQGKKEEKYRIVGVEQKPGTPKPESKP